MNILFFVSSLDSGGIENYLLRFLQHSHHGFERVFVYCKSGRSGQLESRYLELPNIEVVKQKHNYLDIASFKKLSELLKVKKIDAVCDFTGDFSGRTLSVAKKVGINKRVAFYRSAENAFSPTFLKSIYSSWVNYLVRKNATNILSNSKAAFEFFHKPFWQKDERYQVIYNGLDTKQFTDVATNLRAELNIPSNAFVVGHTGRFNQAKNHKTILQVAERLLAKHKDIYFILCGNGVQTNLNQAPEWERFKQRILLFENRTDIPQFLNTMDCYFFPSTREGQPNALIEAMVMGLPFVASDIPPIRETVGEDYSLYPAMDVKALALAIEKEYQDRRGRDTKLQQKMIKRFDYKERFDEFYCVLHGAL